MIRLSKAVITGVISRGCSERKAHTLMPALTISVLQPENLKKKKRKKSKTTQSTQNFLKVS